MVMPISSFVLALICSVCLHVTAAFSTSSANAQRGKWPLPLPSSFYTTDGKLLAGNSLNFTITFDHAFQAAPEVLLSGYIANTDTDIGGNSIAGALAVSVLESSVTEARCVLTILTVTPLYAGVQPNSVALRSSAVDDDASDFPQVSIIYYAWSPGANDDDSDANGHVILVPPQASVVALVTAEFTIPGTYVIVASARGQGLRQAASVTVARLTADYVQFSVVGASSQLCPDGCSHECAPVTSNGDEGIAVNPCEDVWNEPVFVVYKLLSVPPTPAPTISPQPSFAPTEVSFTLPSPLPSLHQMPSLLTPTPTPKPTRVKQSALVLKVSSPPPGHSKVIPTLHRRLLSTQGANDDNDHGNSNDDHGNSNDDHQNSIGDDDLSVIDCGKSEWMWYGEGGDSTFQYRQFAATVNPNPDDTAVYKRVELPPEYANASYSTLVQPAVLLLPVHTDKQSNYAQASAFALTIGHSKYDSFQFVDVVVTKVYDNFGGGFYDYSFGASEPFCLGLAVFNVSVYNKCPHPCQHGECVNGKCVCNEGWAIGPVNKTCSVCAFGYVGNACNQCPGWVEYPADSPDAGELFATCNGFGNCTTTNASETGATACQCEPGYMDEDCSRCVPGYHSVELSNYSTGQTFACLHCPSTNTEECSNHGTCNKVNESNTGAASLYCSCDPDLHFKGPSCSTCETGWAPPACTASCPYACAGIGNCSADIATTVTTDASDSSSQYSNFTCSCPPEYDSKSYCMNCTYGFFGDACSKLCPGMSSGDACFGHGTCSSGHQGSGLCSCQKGYVGNCSGEICSSGFYSAPSKPSPADQSSNNKGSKAHNGTKSCLVCDCDPEGATALDGLTTSSGDPLYACTSAPSTAAGFQCVCKDGYSGAQCSDVATKSATGSKLIFYASVSGAAVLLLLMCGIGMRARWKRAERHGELDAMRQQLLERFPQLKGVEGIFTYRNGAGQTGGIGEWLIPLSDIDVYDSAIGSGASATVFKGRYADGEVAIKRLNPDNMDASDESVRLFFTQEASLLARLNHPNVVRFFGVSYEASTFYIVTEFCPSNLGKVLSASRRKGVKIHDDHVLGLALSIAVGMSYLHAKRVVHRDLKPENVLLTAEGTVKICDFGLSRLFDSSTYATSNWHASTNHGGGSLSAANGAGAQLTSRVGTPAYMAPELIEGKEFASSLGGDGAGFATPDASVDVYSYGILLYALITCEEPYRELRRAEPQALLSLVVDGYRPLSHLMQVADGQVGATAAAATTAGDVTSSGVAKEQGAEGNPLHRSTGGNSGGGSGSGILLSNSSSNRTVPRPNTNTNRQSSSSSSSSFSSSSALMSSATPSFASLNRALSRSTTSASGYETLSSRVKQAQVPLLGTPHERLAAAAKAASNGRDVSPLLLDLMVRCWGEAHSRPSFGDVVTELRTYIGERERARPPSTSPSSSSSSQSRGGGSGGLRKTQSMRNYPSGSNYSNKSGGSGGASGNRPRVDTKEQSALLLRSALQFPDDQQGRYRRKSSAASDDDDDLHSRSSSVGSLSDGGGARNLPPSLTSFPSVPSLAARANLGNRNSSAYSGRVSNSTSSSSSNSGGGGGGGGIGGLSGNVPATSSANSIGYSPLHNPRTLSTPNAPSSSSRLLVRPAPSAAAARTTTIGNDARDESGNTNNSGGDGDVGAGDASEAGEGIVRSTTPDGALLGFFEQRSRSSLSNNGDENAQQSLLPAISKGLPTTEEDEDATADARGDELLSVLSSPNPSSHSSSKKKYVRSDHATNNSSSGGGGGVSGSDAEVDMEQGRPNRQDYV